MKIIISWVGYGLLLLWKMHIYLEILFTKEEEEVMWVLECGTDFRYIQEVLRHKSSKTTEIYTHVSNKDIGKIKSPLDSLQIKGGEDDDCCSDIRCYTQLVAIKYKYKFKR